MGNAHNTINQNNYKRIYGGDLNYPIDIGNTERTGHYVQFFVNVQEQSKVKFPKGNFKVDLNTRQGRGSDVSRESSTLALERAPTKRLAASIQLYMPNQVSVSHSASYSDEEISKIITGTGGAIDKIVGGQFDVGDAALEGAKNLAAGAADKVVTGAKAATNIATGKITNNRQELMFNGIDKRSFSFDFKMVPKSIEESENIKNIVNMFRFHAMPEFYNGSERTMISPSTFDIKYMHKNGEHTFLNRISTCVLESVSVKYGGDRTQFFINTAPSSTEISLSFKELEIITKERIVDGY